MDTKCGVQEVEGGKDCAMIYCDYKLLDTKF